MNANFSENDFQFIKCNIDLGEKGLSNIFIKYNTKILIFVDIKKGYGFMYNEDSALYEELCQNSLINYMAELLQKYFQLFVNYSKKKSSTIQYEDEDVEKLARKKQMKKEQEYTQLLQKLGNTYTLDSIYKCLVNVYYQKDIMTKFDSSEMIPIRNKKVIDLLTGKIIPRTSEHYFTYQYDYDYVPESPLTNKFIQQVTCENEAKQDYLQLLLGVSITKCTKSKQFSIFWGKSGNNAKSTLLNIHSETFKRGSEAIDSNMLFCEKRDKVDATSYGKLFNKTIGIVQEPDNRYVNCPVLKLLTGGDPVDGKKLYFDTFTFTPVIHIFISLNNVIFIKDDADGIMKNRTVVVKFDAVFTSDESKLHLPHHYRADADLQNRFLTNEEHRNDYFSWVVKGAIRYYSFGSERHKHLRQPVEFEHERNQYFDKMDFFKKFLQIHCVEDENGYLLRSSIWNLFEKYQRDNGYEVKENTKSAIFEYLEKRYKLIRPQNVYKYKGIRLKDDNELEKEYEKEIEEEKQIVVEVPQPNSEIAELRKLIEQQQKIIESLQQQLSQPKPEPIPEPEPVSIEIKTERKTDYTKELKQHLSNHKKWEQQSDEYYMSLDNFLLNIIKEGSQETYDQIMSIRNKLQKHKQAVQFEEVNEMVSELFNFFS